MADKTEAKTDGSAPQSLNPWLSWRRKRFWLVITLLAYTLAGFFVAPWLIERQLNKTFSEIGRTVSVEEIKTNPFLLTLEVTGFEIQDTDSTSLLSLGRFFANVQTSSIVNLALTFRTLSIEQPRLFDERFAGSDTRIVRLLQDLTPAESPETDSGDSTPPPVFLQSLSVQDAYLRFRDQTLDGYEAEVGPLTASLANIRTRPDHVGSQVVDLLIHDKDRIQWQGDLQLVPFRSSGTVKVEASAVPQTRELLDYFLPFTLNLESVTANFDYDVAIEAQGFTASLSGLSGEVRGLEAIMSDGQAPLVALPLIRYAGGSIDYPEQLARLEQLQLSGLTVRATLEEDGQLNLLGMIPRSDTPEPAADGGATANPAEPWTTRLDRFELTEGTLILADRTVAPAVEVTLSPMRVTASEIDNQDGTRIPVGFETDLSSGGTVRFEGAAQVLPELELSGTVELESLQTALVQPYVNEFLNVGLSDGELELKAEISHTPEQLLEATGTLTYRQFELQDLWLDEKLAAWDSMSIDRFELNATEKSLATSEVKFSGLYGRVIIAKDLSTNVGDLIVTAGDAGDSEPERDSAPQQGGPAPEFAITVGGVVMENTALDFADFSLPLPFDTAIREMNGTVSALSTTSEEPAAIEIEGRVNEFGLARINGTTQIFDPTNHTDISMVFRNLDISRLTPYTVEFAGYSIDGGRLDLDLGYRLAQRQLQGDNKVVIREMELGDKSDLPGAGSLPLGLAVALLTDSEGVIDLAVPVEGDLDNPEFKIGGVIWRALGNLITKAVTAPFRFLANLVGVESEDFGTLTFQPGSADLSPPDQEQLIKLGEAMLQRPELSVEVAGSWSAELDRPALQAARVEADMDAWLELNPGDADELSVARDRRVLEALTLAGNPDTSLETLQIPFMQATADDPESEAVLDEVAYLAGLRTQLEARVNIDEAQLAELGRSRGQAVINGLREGQPDTPLRINEAEPASVEPGEDNSIRLELAVSGSD